MSDLFEAAGLAPEQPRPLAERLRPQRIGDIVGQEHLLSPEGPIGRMLAGRRLSSMILWGPPGVGKTTIARLLAQDTGFEFQQISAVFSGVADLKKAFETARGRRAAAGRARGSAMAWSRCATARSSRLIRSDYCQRTTSSTRIAISRPTRRRW